MASKTTLATPAFTTEWNGVDAFIDTRSVTVPSGTTHLCVRLVNNSATMPSITFNGDAMTLGPVGDDTDARACAIYYLSAPDVGTFDLVTNSGGVSRSIQALIDVVSASSGVGDTDSAGNFLANRSLTLTTAVGDLVLDVLNSSETATVGAGQTADLLNTGNTSASNEVAAGTSTVMSWTHAGEFTSQAAIVFTDDGSGSGATGTATNILPAFTQSAAGTAPVEAALDAPLQYGAAFTGTYSGLSPTNPDDLVVSDGTRSMTVSTAVNTGAGTFGDTFTALPAAPGDLTAGSAVFPGNVTATFEGVEIETTLSVPTGYATFVVGADPDYTAFDASSWDEADRPVTGEAVIYDTRSGDVTMYDDLTLDAEIEDDDIYLAVIRADGSVDSGFIDTTGVPEVGSSGAAASTLPAMTQASQGDSSQTATVAQVIPLFTQSMSGFTGLGGVLAQTLPSLTQEMAGGIDTGGGISQTLPSFSQSADGTSAAVDDGSETETFNVVYRRRRRA